MRVLSILSLVCLFSCHHPTPTKQPPTEQATSIASSQPTSVAVKKVAEEPGLFRVLDRPVYEAEYETAQIELNELVLAQPEFLILMAILSSESLQEDPAISLLVIRELLVREAKKQGLSVSDEEVQAELESPALQYRPYAGLYVKEDLEGSQRALKRYGWSLGRYKEYVARCLLARKMLLALSSQVAVSEERLKKSFQERETMLSLSLLLLPAEPRFESITLSEQEIEDYAKKNEAQLREIYQSSSDAKPEVLARHILLKLAPNASQTEEETVLKKLRAIQKEIDASGDFGTIAETYSQDGSAPRGGLLGWSSPDAYVSEFRDALIALKTGEVSGLVRTQFGYHIIKLEDVRLPKTFEEVRLSLAKSALQEEQTRLRLQKDGEEILTKAKKTKKLASFKALIPKKAAPDDYEEQSIELSLEELRQTYIQLNAGTPYVLLITPKDAQMLAGLTPQTPLAERIIQQEDVAWIVLLTKRREPDMSAYESKRDELLEEETLGAQLEVFALWLEEQFARAKDPVKAN